MRYLLRLRSFETHLSVLSSRDRNSLFRRAILKKERFVGVEQASAKS
jgi:hypothetical protein